MARIILSKTQADNIMSENNKNSEFEGGWIVMETILSLKSIIPEAEHRNVEVNPNIQFVQRGSLFKLNTPRGSTLWMELRKIYPHVEAAYNLYQKCPNKARFTFFKEDYATYLDSYYFDVNLNIKRPGINPETGKSNYIKVPGTIRISNHEDKPKTFGANEANPSFEIDGHQCKFCVSVVFEKDGPGFAEKDRENNYRVHIFEYKPAGMSAVDLASLVKDVLSRDTLNVGPGEIIDPVQFKEKSNAVHSLFKDLKTPDKIENIKPIKAKEPEVNKAEKLPYKMPDGEVPTLVRFVRMVPRDERKAFVLVDNDTRAVKASIVNQFYEDKARTQCTMYMPLNKEGKVDTHRGYYVSIKKGKIVGIGVVNVKGMEKDEGNDEYYIGKDM